MTSNNHNPNPSIICQFCSKETPGIFNFCAHCRKQIKCINCGGATYEDIDICLTCGQALQLIKNGEKTPNVYTRNIKRSKDNYEENVHFSLSDESVGKIAPFVVGQIMPSNHHDENVSPEINENVKVDTSQFDDINLNKRLPPSNHTVENKQSNIASSNQNNDSTISDFFQIDDGNIVAIENDFKGTNWSEQQKNFIILFVKAHKELLGSLVVDKERIREAAKRLDLVDPNNFTTYLNKISSKYMSKMSSGFDLNSNGNKEAQRILDLMQNEHSPAGYSYTDRNSTGATKRPRISSEEKSIIDSWILEKIDLQKLDVRNIQTGRDAALLALWLITKKLNKLEAVPMYMILYYLNKQFSTISVTPAAISKSIIQNKDADKYFKKNGDGNYFLTVFGQTLVEDWVSGTKSIIVQNS